MWLKITRLDVLGPQNLSYQSAKFGGPRCCERAAITPIVTYLRGEKVTWHGGWGLQLNVLEP